MTRKQKRQNQGETSTVPGKTKGQVKEDLGCNSVSRERVWHAVVFIVWAQKKLASLIVHVLCETLPFKHEKGKP